MSTSSKGKTPKKKTEDIEPKANNAFVFDPADTEKAYEASKKERSAITSIVAMNVDIVACGMIVIGALPHIVPLIPQIATLPGRIDEKIRKLQTYAYAVWHANARAAPPRGERTLKVLTDEAWRLREYLLVNADALVLKGIFSSERVAAIREGRGIEDAAKDLLALYALYSAEWERIGGKTAVEITDVSRAGTLGAEILGLLGARGVEGPVDQAKAIDERARAFTLLVNTYEEVRRAVLFVRYHEGDADQIAPSLYRRRSRSKTAGSEPTSDAAEGDDSSEARAVPNGPEARPAAPITPGPSPTPRPE